MNPMTTTETLPDRAEMVANDTKQANAYGDRARSIAQRESAITTLRRIAGQKRDRNGDWSGTESDARNLTVAPALYQQSQLEDAHAKIGQMDRSIDAAERVIDETQRVWSYWGKWSRFFLVTSSVGHIHSSMSCSTCNWATEFAWLPDLSGLTMADAVEAHGEILCSVCFPDAPVAWSTGKSKVSIAAAETKATEKAARLAAKLAKAINADGTPLRIEKAGGGRFDYEVVATITAAKSRLTDAMDYDHMAWMRQPLALAIAERTGTTVEAELEAARIRNAKRR